MERKWFMIAVISVFFSEGAIREVVFANDIEILEPLRKIKDLFLSEALSLDSKTIYLVELANNGEKIDRQDIVDKIFA